MSARKLTLGIGSVVTVLLVGLVLPVTTAGPPQVGNIEGVTVDEAGVPVGFAQVQLYGGSGNIDWVAETISDADGNFKFRRIQAGDYTAAAFFLTPPPGPSCHGTAEVTVQTRQTTNVTIVMTCGL